MKDRRTEPLTLEIEDGTARLAMRGKTVSVESRHSLDLAGRDGGHVTLHGEIKTGSVSWPLSLNEAHLVWNELFKEMPDARN